ncbi:general odorant-binding protein 83a-like [Photinus pyralis]|nr:general odorant-binding protein 83a-like [Photinus pyralis]
MKFLILAFFVSISVAVKITPDIIESWEATIAPYVEKCKAESNVNSRHVEKLKFLEFAEEKEFFCYVKCLYKNIEFIDKNGNINIDQIVKLSIDIDIATKCKERAEPEGDECRKAFILLTCIVDYMQ